MKYFSLFSGAGGFELGIQQAYELSKLGIKSENSTDSKSKSSQYGTNPLCVGYSEIDKYAIQIYEKHFNHKNYGDCSKINWNEVPNFDLLVGGSPCQDFSIAGKREGIGGERSGLVWEFIRALKEKKPRYFIWENVKGVMSSRKGFDFASILTAFSESGYSLWWQVLNAKDFGVPQNRERVFVVGCFGGECGREVFFERGDSKKIISKTIRKGGRSSLDKKHSWDLIEMTKGESQGYRVYDPKGIATNQASQAGGLGAKTGLYAIPVLTPDRIIKRQNGRRMKTDGEPSFTLNTQDKHGIFNGTRIRRLTPLECERLMSWKDNWTKGVSDTQRYKLCGNGVVSKVVQVIMENLIL